MRANRLHSIREAEEGDDGIYPIPRLHCVRRCELALFVGLVRHLPHRFGDHWWVNGKASCIR